MLEYRIHHYSRSRKKAQSKMARALQGQRLIPKPSQRGTVDQDNINTSDVQKWSSTRDQNGQETSRCSSSGLPFWKIYLSPSLGLMLAAVWSSSTSNLSMSIESPVVEAQRSRGAIAGFCQRLLNIMKSILGKAVSAETINTYCVMANNAAGKACQRTSSTLAMIFEYADHCVRSPYQR